MAVSSNKELAPVGEWHVATPRHRGQSAEMVCFTDFSVFKISKSKRRLCRLRGKQWHHDHFYSRKPGSRFDGCRALRVWGFPFILMESPIFPWPQGCVDGPCPKKVIKANETPFETNLQNMVLENLNPLPSSSILLSPGLTSLPSSFPFWKKAISRHFVPGIVEPLRCWRRRTAESLKGAVHNLGIQMLPFF